MTLRARAERALGLRCEGHLTRDGLARYDEVEAPGTIPPEVARGLEGGSVLLTSRCALDLRDAPLPEGPARLVVAGETVGWIIPDGSAFPSDASLLDTTAEPGEHPEEVELSGEILEAPWDLVRRNPDRIRRDAEALWSDTASLPGVHRVGEGRLSIASGAEMEPGVVVDLRGGPVRLEAGARVEAPARLVGPLHIGSGSTVLGGHVERSSIGPICKVRGEVADSVLLGYVNKAHDGYMGHALLGRWVNLGALTTNSDLKNNYGSVAVWTPAGPTDTGLMKVGCFLGDHVKTGIGTVLNTGTVVGAGSNLFGGAMPPVMVPPFSWGSGSDLTDYRLDKFLESAERAMGRRDVVLTPDARALLEQAWYDTVEIRRTHQPSGA